MAILLNRKYCSRIECLYYILKTTYKNFKDSPFTISDIKYDESKDYNIFNFCQLTLKQFDIEYCPYLDNPLYESKCYATQSLDFDNTKAKAASAIVRAFEGLGLIESTNNGEFIINESGNLFCNLDYNSKDWFNLIRECILSYGPIIGYLFEANKQKMPFNKSKIYVGYPMTDEPIEISSYSTKDSNSRTLSLLTSWCIYGGLIEPNDNRNYNNILPQIYYREILNKKTLPYKKFILTEYAKNYLESEPFIDNPLSYNSLNKNVGSLRERNSETLRVNTLKYNPIILNRRFALIYILNLSKCYNKDVSLIKLLNIFKCYEQDFFLPNSNIQDVLQSELKICQLAGLMINVTQQNITILNSVNLKKLSENVPNNIIDTCNKMVEML